VEKYAMGAAKDFTLVGASFIAATAAVTGGTIKMMESVAKQDLGFALYARRMFMGEAAAKKMKIATDALGYSLEDILWGPRELGDRYRRLVQDQTKMMELLGPGFEAKMYGLREIGFQFDRMGVAVQYFGMRLTEDILDKMFGGSQSLQQRLKGFVDWFESKDGFVRISDTVSGIIAPAFLMLGHAIEKMWDTAKGVAEWVSHNPKEGTFGMRSGFRFKEAQPQSSLARSVDRIPGGSLLAPGVDPLLVWLKTQSPSKSSWLDSLKRIPGFAGGLSSVERSIPTDKYRLLLQQYAKQYGVPEGLALAEASKESGMNPFPHVGSRGELGMMQLMPATVEALQKMWPGFDPNDPEQNIKGGMYTLSHKPGKTWEEKIRRYNGRGKAAEDYRDDVMKRWQDYDLMLGNKKGDFNFRTPPAMGPLISPMAYHPAPTTNMGGVTINIQQPNATPEQIKSAVRDGIEEHAKLAAVRSYAQRQGAFV
jgi:hypothetical protein